MPTPTPELVPARRATAAIALAGLGYFVDIFDLLLFAVVRVPSVRDIAGEAQLLSAGTLLQNTQLIGMMIGGVAWGVLGDKRGRRSVLYGSILLYSLANLGNATATSIEAYVAWRFLAGLGLAGELGAALTIVSELVEPKERGLATTIVATMGVIGAVAAALVGGALPWRTAYVIGGVLGLILLVVRFQVRDSAMFARTRAQVTTRGSFVYLLGTPARALRYARAILIGVPVWFTSGLLVTFAPEFARTLGITGTVSAGTAVLCFYGATTFGDLTSGLLSQYWKSRRRAAGLYLALTATGVALYLGGVASTTAGFYLLYLWLGFSTGYWAVMVTMAVEQFGTDLRATVGTSVPTFVRATTVPMTLAWTTLQPMFGLRGAAAVVGAVVFGLAGWAVWRQSLTYGTDLDFVESAPDRAPMARAG
ncbi:MAG: MFS transporter [Gemmatimonadetes bacterium]|nr:MFS transporter [Gemmatimonadota bacterium]